MREGKDVVWYGTNTDIEDLKQAEGELRRREADLRKAQAELAHVTRITTMGELVASIAHEVNQPVGAMMLNANSCVRWLAHLKDESTELREARKALQRVIQDGLRTGEIINRIRALVRKTESVRQPLDINSIFHEVIAFSKNEMEQRQARLRLDLAGDLPLVLGDRVQLQQVMINLILNGIEAMTAVDDRARELVIETQQLDHENVLASVRDTGVGFDADKAEQLFTAFHTTKPGGLGMGLSISRSIIDDHGGKLWATRNEGVGATFHFSLPALRVSPPSAFSDRA